MSMLRRGTNVFEGLPFGDTSDGADVRRQTLENVTTIQPRTSTASLPADER